MADAEFTTSERKARVFHSIGDAMRECVRVNGLELGFATKFKVIPYMLIKHKRLAQFLHMSGIMLTFATDKERKE